MKQNDFFEEVRINIEEYMGESAKVTLNEIIKNSSVYTDIASIVNEGV